MNLQVPWGTMSHTTSKSVENVITRCCNLAGLKIRRKTRTADTGKISWWFVIHANEAVLCELDSKWESVNLQTSWQLQSCLKPALVNDAETHAVGASSLLDENPSGNTGINKITIEATTIPNATSTTVPISCNPTVPNSVITTDQPLPTASFFRSDPRGGNTSKPVNNVTKINLPISMQEVYYLN